MSLPRSAKLAALVACLSAPAGLYAAEEAGAAAEQPPVIDTEIPVSTQAVPAPGPEEEFGDEFDEEFERPPEAKVFDPLEPVNRAFFVFNDKFYFWLWRPTARAYRWAVPEFLRKGINNAFTNITMPVRFGNSLLQAKPKRAGAELGRFIVNTTVGVGGLWDPAEKWLGLKPPPVEDFGQTLGRYGVGDGIPIVLPFLGPMNLRDGVGLIPDIALHPVFYFANTYEGLGLRSGEIFNRSSLHLGEYETLRNDALDPYTFFRAAYTQNREKAVRE